MNSPLKNPNPTFAFNVVRFSTVEPYNHPQEGLCTTWIERFCDPVCNNRSQGRALITAPEATIPVFLKPAGDFYAPDPEVPLIMIGPGTGVAPFVGFLQHRKTQRESNNHKMAPSWLFYGCRHRDKDFLFKEELEGFVRQVQVRKRMKDAADMPLFCFYLFSDGTLSKLVVSYSREETTTDTTKYVHHLMRAHGRELHDLIVLNHARIFVCG